MDLLIIFIAITGGWYYLKKKDEEKRQEKAEQKQSFGHHPDSKVSYATTIPTDIRRKNAIEAYLNSNRSSIKPLDAKKTNVDYSEQDSADNDSEIQREEITPNDLLVNSQTGEIVTPGKAFNGNQEVDSDDVGDNSTVLPANSEIPADQDQKASSTDRNSSPNQSNYDLTSKKVKQPKDWKKENDQAINELLK